MKRGLIDPCFEKFFQENTYKKPEVLFINLFNLSPKRITVTTFFVCSILRHRNKLSSFDINITTIKLFQNKIGEKRRVNMR